MAPGLLVAFTFFRSAPPRSTHFYTSHIDYLQMLFFRINEPKIPPKSSTVRRKSPPLSRSQLLRVKSRQDQGDYVSLFHASFSLQQPRTTAFTAFRVTTKRCPCLWLDSLDHHHHQAQDRVSWKTTSNNRTNGLVVDTHVYLPLRRSSLVGLVPQSIFSCSSAFLCFYLSLAPTLTTQSTSVYIFPHRCYALLHLQFIPSTGGCRRYS